MDARTSSGAPVDVDADLVRALAKAVRVDVPEQMFDEMIAYFNDILNYFNELQMVDISDVDLPPIERDAHCLRPDEVHPGLDVAALRALAGDAFDPDERLFELQGVFETIER